MQKWVLAIAGSCLLFGCGSDDPNGSLRYEPPSTSNHQKAESSTSSTARQTTKRDKADSVNAKEEQGSEEGESKISGEALSKNERSIPSTTLNVDWKLTALDPAFHANISQIDLHRLVVTVVDSNYKTWDAVEVPIDAAAPTGTYAEYTLTQTTWSRSEQTLAFWINISTFECQLTWNVKGWTSSHKVLMHGHCKL